MDENLSYLLKAKKQIQKIEKDIQTKKGMIQSNINQLKDLTDIDSEDEKVLLKEAEKVVKELEQKIEESSKKVDKMIAEVKEQMEQYENI